MKQSVECGRAGPSGEIQASVAGQPPAQGRGEAYATHPDGSDPLFHWIALSVSAAILTGAALLQVDGGRVIVPVVNQALPGLCTFQTLFGIGCAGCGLTRCFVCLMHGDLAGAWNYNAAGFLVFMLIACQLPLRLLQLQRLRRGLPEWRLGLWGPVSGWCCLGALLVQWVCRMA
ncbi:MAG: DUF2752 domain-containing protein [Pirellulaceae bacterium]